MNRIRVYLSAVLILAVLPRPSVADEVNSALVPLPQHETISETGFNGPRRDSFSTCGESPWQIRADYLMWWTDGTYLPALVTTSPDGTAREQAGVLGEPGTRILSGDQYVGNGLRHGGRLLIGYQPLDWDSWGIEATYYGLGVDQNDGDFLASSSGSPILARPFFNTDLGGEDSELVAFQDLDPVLAGSVAIDMHSEMHSVAASLKRNIFVQANRRCAFIGGYRYFRYREGLSIRENLTSTDTTDTLIPLGTTVDVFDQFGVTNDFHGGEVGLATQRIIGSLCIEGLAKIAIGGLRKTARIEGGATVVTPPPESTTATSNGGLLALPSNTGTYGDTEFAVLPELGVNLRLDLTERLSFSVGYTLLYLDNAWRVGGQIDRCVDPTQITNLEQAGTPAPGAHPAPQLAESDFWAQGLSLGVVFWLP